MICFTESSVSFWPKQSKGYSLFLNGFDIYLDSGERSNVTVRSQDLTQRFFMQLHIINQKTSINNLDASTTIIQMYQM